jgi:hypothetical protein
VTVATVLTGCDVARSIEGVTRPEAGKESGSIYRNHGRKIKERELERNKKDTTAGRAKGTRG